MLKESIQKIGLMAAMIPLSFIPNPARAQLTIVLSGTVDLNFGEVSEGGAGGTVVMSTAGVRSTTGSVTPVVGSGLESRALFSVSGSTGLAIDLSVSSPAALGTMVVNDFNLVTNAGGAVRTITLANNPTTLPMGATLNVNAGQAPGTYSGTYTLNANYQ